MQALVERVGGAVVIIGPGGGTASQIREGADNICLVSFMGYDPGFFDETQNTMVPVGENPVAPKVLPM